MYIWAEDGPFIKSGGWDSSKQENMVIIKDVFTSPEYLLTFIIKSLNYKVLQIGNILIPKKLPAVGYPSSPSYYIKNTSITRKATSIILDKKEESFIYVFTAATPLAFYCIKFIPPLYYSQSKEPKYTYSHLQYCCVVFAM